MTSTTAITNVAVFDGFEYSAGPHRVTMSDGRITAIEDARATESANASEAVVDGAGATLLPGLIDTHVHAADRAQVERATGWGVTTQLDMGAPDLPATLALRDVPGLGELRTAGYPALAPGAAQLEHMGFPAAIAVDGPGDAARFVHDRIDQGSDYIKIILEDSQLPNSKPLSLQTVAAIVTAAHAARMLTIAHVTSIETTRKAVQGGVDVVTHTALNAQFDPEFTSELAQRPVVLVPTLSMMSGVVGRLGPLMPPGAPPMDYKRAVETVAAFRTAGKPVLAGTDSNDNPAAPFQLPHGSSLHEELERLVAAGLPTIEALRAATGLAARIFGLSDRGVVTPGHRADLLLVDGDPTADITATRSIRGVWVKGEQVR